jgi:hypothetical protein
MPTVSEPKAACRSGDAELVLRPPAPPELISVATSVGAVVKPNR